MHGVKDAEIWVQLTRERSSVPITLLTDNLIARGRLVFAKDAESRAGAAVARTLHVAACRRQSRAACDWSLWPSLNKTCVSCGFGSGRRNRMGS